MIRSLLSSIASWWLLGGARGLSFSHVGKPIARRRAIQALILLPHSNPCPAYDPDPDPLRESLYFVSRVQEATVQQERLVRNADDQRLLKEKMKLSLRLIERNYRILDQVTYCAGFASDVVGASSAGNEAAEELQNAIDFVNGDLGAGKMEERQRDFLVGALGNAREKIFEFVEFMPRDKLEGARRRIEEENKLNVEEFDGDENAGVYNPVVLPWKNRK